MLNSLTVCFVQNTQMAAPGRVQTVSPVPVAHMEVGAGGTVICLTLAHEVQPKATKTSQKGQRVFLLEIILKPE